MKGKLGMVYRLAKIMEARHGLESNPVPTSILSFIAHHCPSGAKNGCRAGIAALKECDNYTEKQTVAKRPYDQQETVDISEYYIYRCTYSALHSHQVNCSVVAIVLVQRAINSLKYYCLHYFLPTVYA